jgi:hypothetical protein
MCRRACAAVCPDQAVKIKHEQQELGAGIEIALVHALLTPEFYLLSPGIYMQQTPAGVTVPPCSA